MLPRDFERAVKSHGVVVASAEGWSRPRRACGAHAVVV